MQKDNKLIWTIGHSTRNLVTLWWRCQRSLISDYLKLYYWTVMHITGIGKTREHTYTSRAKIVNGELLYTELA